MKTVLTLTIEDELARWDGEIERLQAQRGWSRMRTEDLQAQLEPLAKLEAEANALAVLMNSRYCPFIDAQRWVAHCTIPRSIFRKYWLLITEIIDEREEKIPGVGKIVAPWED